MSGGHRAESPLAGAFHARSGWYFKRADNGSVTIWPGDGDDITLDAASWASVVASVSATGENYESYQTAITLHTGSSPPPM